MPFKSYVAELKTIRNSGQATENSYYTALGSLIEDLDPSVAVVINPKKTPHGSPDFRLTRKRTIEFPVGWIEAKLPGEDFDKIARSEPGEKRAKSTCVMGKNCYHCVRLLTEGAPDGEAAPCAERT